MAAIDDMARIMLRTIASDPEALAELADALAPHLGDNPDADRWMNAKAAAAYLGLPSVNARNRGAPNGKAGNTKGPQSRASHADRGAGI